MRIGVSGFGGLAFRCGAGVTPVGSCGRLAVGGGAGLRPVGWRLDRALVRRWRCGRARLASRGTAAGWLVAGVRWGDVAGGSPALSLGLRPVDAAPWFRRRQPSHDCPRLLLGYLGMVRLVPAVLTGVLVGCRATVAEGCQTGIAQALAGLVGGQRQHLGLRHGWGTAAATILLCPGAPHAADRDHHVRLLDILGQE